MVWQRSVVTLMMVGIWVLTPDVLCLLPGFQMTLEEHECCQRMAGQCDIAPMPDLHKCCRNVTRADLAMPAKEQSAAGNPVFQSAPTVTSPALGSITISDLLRNPLNEPAQFQAGPPHVFSILRI